MLTQAEIIDILREFNTGMIGYSTDISAAAEAIAAEFSRARLIIEMLADSDGDAHQVGECIKAARELLGKRKPDLHPTLAPGLDEIQRMLDAGYTVAISKRSGDVIVARVLGQCRQVVSVGGRTDDLVGALMFAYRGTPEASEQLVENLREVIE